MLLSHSATGTSSILLTSAIILLVCATNKCQMVMLQGTNADAEYLSAITKDVHEQNSKTSNDKQISSIVAVGESRQATDAPTNSSAASAIASQVSSALSQLDLGFGYYKMCPFPFSYLHQCEASSDCPDSDCCGMYAFPGPNRWRRSCCVPDSVTTIARVASLCIKGAEKPAAESGSGSRPSIPSASSVFQNVVAQALGVSDSSDDEDDDIK